jgi:hypothetical protein
MRIDLLDVLTQPIQEPHWLVHGMFMRGTLVVLAGEPGVGKSTLSYYLAFAVAAGVPFLGHTTTPTRVLYIDEENSRPDLIRYASRVWRGLNKPSVESVRLEHFSLPPRWQPELLRLVRDWAPGLIIIDTASSALHLTDENDNAEASRAIHMLRQAQTTAGDETTLLVLKHERQRDDIGHRRTIRGAKTWLGQADAVFYHVFPQGSRERNDGLRKTQLEQDKLRSYGLDCPIEIIPSWTDASRSGLILQGEKVVARKKATSRDT